MDGIDAIKGSKIRGGGLQVGAGAFGANQQADSNGRRDPAGGNKTCTKDASNCLGGSRSCVRITKGAFNTPNDKKRSGGQAVPLVSLGTTLCP